MAWATYPFILFLVGVCHIIIAPQAVNGQIKQSSTFPPGLPGTLVQVSEVENYFTESSNAHLHCLSSSINLTQKSLLFDKTIITVIKILFNDTSTSKNESTLRQHSADEQSFSRLLCFLVSLTGLDPARQNI